MVALILLRTPPGAPAAWPYIVASSNLDQEPDESFSTVIVRDAPGRERALNFIPENPGLDATSHELSPLQPAFDVRFASNRVIELSEPNISRDIALRISDAEYLSLFSETAVMKPVLS